VTVRVAHEAYAAPFVLVAPKRQDSRRARPNPDRSAPSVPILQEWSDVVRRSDFRGQRFVYAFGVASSRVGEESRGHSEGVRSSPIAGEPWFARRRRDAEPDPTKGRKTVCMAHPTRWDRTTRCSARGQARGPAPTGKSGVGPAHFTPVELWWVGPKDSHLLLERRAVRAGRSGGRNVAARECRSFHASQRIFPERGCHKCVRRVQCRPQTHG
jgi:hypothetical protein